jgi:hypothetical protein
MDGVGDGYTVHVYALPQELVLDTVQFLTAFARETWD